MLLEQNYSFVSSEGHEYLIGFSKFDVLVMPDGIDRPVVNVVIAIEDNKGINNASTLFKFTSIIREYLDEHDVILYCYCDINDIDRSEKHQHLAPQEYRSLLFKRMFDRSSESDYINKPIVLIDLEGNSHYVHLIANVKNEPVVERLAEEIGKINK